MSVDLDARSMVVALADGAVINDSLPEGLFPPSLQIRAWTVNVREGTLDLTLPSGVEILVETGGFGGDPLDRAGRPVVYLDQNHWIELAKAIWNPTKVSHRLRHAAATLVERARAGDLILPVSAGHVIEMGPLEGRRRSDLCSTILALSRGWQMRNPLVVRGLSLIHI